MPELPALRQVVLLAADLQAALEEAKSLLGLRTGIRDAQSMAKLGFTHEVLAVDETFLEIVSPMASDSSAGRLLARQGEGGFMVVVQVDDVEAMVARAAAIGLKPLMHEEFEGNPLTQWHPRDLGTLAEIDQMRVGEWHFCPALSDTGCTDVVSDLMSADIAGSDPAELARRWATVLDLPLADGATTLRLGGRELRFVPETGRTGLVAMTYAASRPASGDCDAQLCGVSVAIRRPAPTG